MELRNDFAQHLADLRRRRHLAQAVIDDAIDSDASAIEESVAEIDREIAVFATALG